MDAKHILMVEDDERDIELMMTALADTNLANEIVVARDGAEALDYLMRRGDHAGRAPGQPVVVFLDLKLPKVDGLQVLREIKQHPDLATIPVVIVTSSREDRDIVQGYKLGVNAYVVKPVGFKQFMAAIQELGLFWVVINQPPPGSVQADTK